MRLSPLLSRWLKNRPRNSRPDNYPALLRLETFESRVVPATFLVTNHLDTTAPGSLRWAIGQANAAGSGPNTIDIEASAAGKVTLTAALPTIVQPVTIDNLSGGTFTVCAGYLHPIFVVGAPVTLDKLVLSQGKSANGGAIDVTKTAGVAVNSCTVKYSVATGDGGGLYSAGGGVTIVRSTFTENKAGASGGAILVKSGTAALSHATISDNTATDSGGGVFAADGAVRLTLSLVDSNHAQEVDGGGVWAFGDVTLAGERTAGHTVYATVNSNIAGQYGGGIYSVQGKIDVSFATVNFNSAKGFDGGGIADSNGSVTLGAGGQAAVNHAAGVGGGIYVAHGDVTVAVNGVVNSNTATGNGGGVFVDDGNATVNGRVKSNAGKNGGGVAVANGDVDITGSILDNTGHDGGGVYDGDGDVTAAGTENGNVADYGNGGAIFDAKGLVTVAGGEVELNTAIAWNGGGVYDASGTVAIHALVHGNRAVDGGGIYVAKGDVSIAAGGAVKGNVATDGGGIFVATGNVEVKANGLVQGNVAVNSGGGIYVQDGDATISGTVKGNVADNGRGGGIFVASGTVTVAAGGIVTGNQSRVNYTYGVGSTGGVGIVTSGTSGPFTGSSGTSGYSGGGGGYTGYSGGGSFGSGGGSGGFSSGGWSGGFGSGGGSGGGSAIVAVKPLNKPATKAAVMGGGGIFVNQGDVTVDGGQVTDNVALGSGGGICDIDGSVSVTDGGTIDKNTADAKGGGIFDEATSNTVGVHLDAATVQSNVAQFGGGGVFVNTGDLDILDSSVEGNIAQWRSGGGVADADRTGSVNIANSTIGDNSATFSGGGIRSAGNATIDNSTVVLNTLQGYPRGAGIDTAGPIDINNTIVAGNTYRGSEQDISGRATGSNNAIGSAGSAGGLVNGQDDNIVGLNGTGTRPVGTIINTHFTNNGGPTDTYALVLGSVALEAGNSSLNPTTVTSYDQRGPGYPRTDQGSMDIGAVEDGGFGVVFSQGDTVRVFGQDNVLLGTITPFAGTAVKAVSVAVGDVKGSGLPDIIVGSANNLGEIEVYNGNTGKLVSSFEPYGSSYTGGLNVALGEVVAGQSDIIVGPGEAGKPVKVLNAATGNVVASFTPFPQQIPNADYTGGVQVAAGNLTGDSAGTDEVIVGTSSPQGGYLEVWTDNGGTMAQTGQSFDIPGLGVYLAAGDLNSGGAADIVVGTGVQSGSTAEAGLYVIDGVSGQVIASLPQTSLGVFSPASVNEPVRVAVRAVTADGDADIEVAAGPGPTQQVRLFTLEGSSLELQSTLSSSQLDLPGTYTGGIYVG